MKKTLVSLLTLIFVFGAFSTTYSQDDNKDYLMWETIMLSPDLTKLKVLGENLRKHNQKYHKEGAHQASVYNITTGPHTGKLVWIMGPLKFADLDTRPAVGGHDEDWRDNIMPNLKKIEQAEYWKGDNDLSNTSMLTENPADRPVLFTRYWEINLEHGHNVERMLKQISETVKAMEGENPWGVYYNQFRQGTKIGRHIATVGFYKNWAEFDEDNSFKKTYLKTHGEDSWDAFIRDMDQVLDNSWDEVWEYNKELSGQ